MTRRKVLRNVGSTALGAAVTAAYLGTRPEVAEAICEVPVNRCGSAAESPICGGFRCRANGYCDAARADTAWRTYFAFHCPGTGPQCWTNVHRGVNYRCCDCAGRDAPCGTIIRSGNCGSGGPWRACICVAPV